MADNSTILEKLDGLVARLKKYLPSSPTGSNCRPETLCQTDQRYKDLDDLMKARKELYPTAGQHRRSQKHPFE